MVHDLENNKDTRKRKQLNKEAEVMIKGLLKLLFLPFIIVWKIIAFMLGGLKLLGFCDFMNDVLD